MNASENLAAAAEAATDCLGVDARDQVLVLCNHAERAVAEALVAAAQSRTDAVRLLEYPALSRNGEELPGHVAHAMQDATVVFATTTYSISHTEARLAEPPPARESRACAASSKPTLRRCPSTTNS
jgi:hypothetical protein